MNFLYKDVGKVFKTLAAVKFFIEVITIWLSSPVIMLGSTIIFIVLDLGLMCLLAFPIGITFLICGTFISLLNSWIIYGFGEIIDSNVESKKLLSEIKASLVSSNARRNNL